MASAETVTVQVWLGWLPADTASVAAAMGQVTSQEIAESEVRPPALRDAWVLRRVFRRQVLAQALSVRGEDISFSNGAAGKPSLLLGGRQCDWQFSTSHSQGLVGLALVRGFPVGLDLECCLDLPDQRRLAAGFPEPLASRLEDAPARGFYASWVTWEAVAKAAGCGLGPGLGRFVPACQDGWFSVSGVRQQVIRAGPISGFELRDAQSGHTWWATGIGVPMGFAGALATPRSLPFEVRTVHWPPGGLPEIIV